MNSLKTIVWFPFPIKTPLLRFLIYIKTSLLRKDESILCIPLSNNNYAVYKISYFLNLFLMQVSVQGDDTSILVNNIPVLVYIVNNIPLYFYLLLLLACRLDMSMEDE